MHSEEYKNGYFEGQLSGYDEGFSDGERKIRSLLTEVPTEADGLAAFEAGWLACRKAFAILNTDGLESAEYGIPEDRHEAFYLGFARCMKYWNIK